MTKSLSPSDVVNWLESMPPVEIKNRLMDYLQWQANHGKRLLHSAHYFRLLHYGYKPRPETEAKRTADLRKLTGGIGKTL